MKETNLMIYFKIEVVYTFINELEMKLQLIYLFFLNWAANRQTGYLMVNGNGTYELPQHPAYYSHVVDIGDRISIPI